MPCVNPLIGLAYNNRRDGKKTLKVMSFEEGKNIPDVPDRRKILLPCGHCIACRTEQAKEWSNRLLMESKYHEDMYFITLTYCEEYSLRVPSFDPDTGEYQDKETLCKKDLQEFFKRLRRNFKKDKFRYYACGEYGPKKGKPHFHIILFVDWHKENDKKIVGFDDLKYIGISESGQPNYKSEILDSLWCLSDKRSERYHMPKKSNSAAADAGRDPDLLGWAEIAIANERTIRYTANYCQKKLGVRSNDYWYSQNLQPPFAVSSRKPGIGYQYLEEHPEVMSEEKIYLSSLTGVKEFSPPRYFRKKLAEYDRKLYDELGEKHKMIAEDKLKCRLENTSLDEQDYRKVEESNLLHKRSSRAKIN